MTADVLKMDRIILHCPLCCDEAFSSKQALADHLSNYSKFTCPLCNNNFESILFLAEHLRGTDCYLPKTPSLLVGPDIRTKSVLVNLKVEGSLENTNYDSAHSSEYQDHSPNDELPEDGMEVETDTMYEELLGESLSKDMSLLEENGHSKYTIMAHNEVPAIMSGGSVITKQNSDGTISITAVEKESDSTMKLESDPIITVAEKESSSQEELYSCNTCGVAFSSVLQHIQERHKDQDVVVEVNDTSNNLAEESNKEDIPITFMSLEEMEGVTKNPMNYVSVKQDESEPLETHSTARRVITDTGDIVETTSQDSILGQDIHTDTSTSQSSIPLSLSLEEEVVDKKGRLFTRRYVQIDKIDSKDNIESETAKNAQKSPFHQVVIKEIVTMDGGNKMKVYNCIACHIYVTELEEFKLHPCKSLKYCCMHCPVSYENAKSLCAHMKVHKIGRYSNPDAKRTEVEIIQGPFKCDVCSTIFPTNKSLKLHRRMHNAVKPREIEPPVEEDGQIAEHAHGDKYFCAFCEKWIPKGYKNVHDDFHNNIDNFNCDICNKKFTSNAYLIMHMTVHNTEKAVVKKSDKSLPYTCLYCNRQFARPHEKVKHERIHTGEKPHTCEICGKSFRVSYCLTLHMRTHTGARPYACQQCGKRFKAHSVYNHHLLTHSDVRAYKCPYCPKAFKTSVQLAGHKNSHTKPFACTHCNRPFASLYAVRVHTETHRRQNNLKFSCSLCGASYARSFALKDHMKQVHQTDADTADSMAMVAFNGIPGLTEDKDWNADNITADGDISKTHLHEELELEENSQESETVIT